MKARCLFLFLPACLFAGCRHTGEGKYGIGYGVMVLAGTAYDETSDAVQYATKKHIYASPSTRFSDFETRIAQAEHLRFISWGAHLEPDSNFSASHAYVFLATSRRWPCRTGCCCRTPIR